MIHLVLIFNSLLDFTFELCRSFHNQRGTQIRVLRSSGYPDTHNYDIQNNSRLGGFIWV